MQGSVGALAMHYFVNPPRGNTDRLSELVLRDAEALNEVLRQDLARVNRHVKPLSNHAPQW